MKACIHYFSVFWKNNVLLGYFEWSPLKRNLTHSCFIFPLFHQHLFSPALPGAACLLKTSFFEKMTVCVIETMLVMLPLVQMKKAQREVNQQIKRRSRWNRDSSKKYLITFQVVVPCKSSSNLNIVILSNLDNIWCILNEWRIFSEHTFLLHLYQQKFKMQQ